MIMPEDDEQFAFYTTKELLTTYSKRGVFLMTEFLLHFQLFFIYLFIYLFNNMFF